MFLGPPDSSSRGGDATIGVLDILCCGNRWPFGEVLLIEGRVESTERLGALMSLIELKLPLEP